MRILRSQGRSVVSPASAQTSLAGTVRRRERERRVSDVVWVVKAWLCMFVGNDILLFLSLLLLLQQLIMFLLARNLLPLFLFLCVSRNLIELKRGKGV